MKQNPVIDIRIPTQVIHDHHHGYKPDSMRNWHDELILKPFLLAEELSVMEDTAGFIRKYENKIKITLEWENLTDLNKARPWETESLRSMVQLLNSTLGSIFYYLSHEYRYDDLRLYAACLTDPALVRKEDGKPVVSGMDVYLGESGMAKELGQFDETMQQLWREAHNKWGCLTPGHQEEKLLHSRWNSFMRIEETEVRRLRYAILNYQGFYLRLGCELEESIDMVSLLLERLGIDSKQTWDRIFDLCRDGHGKIDTTQLNASAALPLNARVYYRQAKGLPSPHWRKS